MPEYKIENTEGWSFERLAPYTRDLTAAIRKFVDRYPNETTADAIVSDAAAGKLQIWLVLDDDDSFKSFFTTRTATFDATGVKVTAISSFGGTGGLKAAPQACEAAEAYADSQGADIYQAECREGWGKVMKALGYEIHSVVWRKKAKT